MAVTININQTLGEFYQGDIPGYVIRAEKSFIIIRVGEIGNGAKPLKITVKDVVEYYYIWARNIVSSCRIIAGLAGDWRPIANLANECLEWFKLVNRTALASEGRKYGMELKN